MPDVGLTPFGLSQGPAGSAGITALVDGYNQTLFGGLQAAGLRVIPLDTFHFLREIAADPGAVRLHQRHHPGLRRDGIAGLQSGQFRRPGRGETYAFADGVHPSTAAHAMLARYAVSVLEAPSQIAVLPHSEAMVGRSRADRVAAHLDGKPAGDGMRWWSDLRGDFQRYGDGDQYDGAGPSLSVGIDWASGNLGLRRLRRLRPAVDRLGPPQRQLRPERCHARRLRRLVRRQRLGQRPGQLQPARLRHRSRRRSSARPRARHHGSADGSNLSVGVSAGWEFGDGALRHGPVLSVLSQQIDVDGFAESDPTLSTSLAYPDQNVRFADRQRRLAGQLHDQRAPAAVRARDLGSRVRGIAGRSVRAGAVDAGHDAVRGAGRGVTTAATARWCWARARRCSAWTPTSASAPPARRSGGNDASVFATFGSSF